MAGGTGLLMRAYIQASGRPVAELARELGISETTVRRWRQCRTVSDRHRAAHAAARVSDILCKWEGVRYSIW